MNIPELFIRRPVMTTLVMSGILLFGIISYRYLAVSDLPNVDYPTIQVQALLPDSVLVLEWLRGVSLHRIVLPANRELPSGHI